MEPVHIYPNDAIGDDHISAAAAVFVQKAFPSNRKISVCIRSKGVAGRFPHIIDRHSTGAGSVPAEGAAGYHTLFSGPKRRAVKIVAALYIREGIAPAGPGRTVGPPEESQNLRHGAVCVGGKGGSGSPRGNFLVHGPPYRVREVVAFFHISKAAHYLRCL